MIYKEEYRDLFSVTDDYYLAHCISADFGMGAGIAVQFNKRFNMKNKLIRSYPTYIDKFRIDGVHGDCILHDKVFNLITKERYWDKPTYTLLFEALQQMYTLCDMYGIKKIAMPTIGAGLDKLDWNKVSTLIKDVFKNTDIEILVCRR